MVKVVVNKINLDANYLRKLMGVDRILSKLMQDKQLYKLAYLAKENPSWVKMPRLLNMSQLDYYRKRTKDLCELTYKLEIEVEVEG